MLNRRAFCLASAATLALPAAARAATGGAADASLDRAFDAFFQSSLDESPVLATSLGLDTGARAASKARLDDGSLAAVARRKRLVAERLARLRTVDRAQLGPAAAINYDAVLYDLAASDAAGRRFPYGNGVGSPYVLSQTDGAYQWVPDFLDSQHTIATAADADAYLARLEGFAAVMDQEIERTRHDVALGVVPPTSRSMARWRRCACCISRRIGRRWSARSSAAPPPRASRATGSAAPPRSTRAA